MKINVALFKPKSDNPKAPDYAGDFPLPCECPCCHHKWDRFMRLAVWRRTGKDDKHYVGGALEDAADRPGRPRMATDAPPTPAGQPGGQAYTPAPNNPPEPKPGPPEPAPRSADGTELPF